MSDDRGTGISNRIITLDVDTWMGAGQARTKKLKQFQERPLDNFDFVVFFIDGKSFADEQIVIALGVTMDGQKIPLGFVESATENERVCRQLIQDLISGGDQGLLVVLDGSKGLYSTVTKALKGQSESTAASGTSRRMQSAIYLNPNARESGASSQKPMPVSFRTKKRKL